MCVREKLGMINWVVFVCSVLVSVVGFGLVSRVLNPSCFGPVLYPTCFGMVLMGALLSAVALHPTRRATYCSPNQQFSDSVKSGGDSLHPSTVLIVGVFLAISPVRPSSNCRTNLHTHLCFVSAVPSRPARPSWDCATSSRRRSWPSQPKCPGRAPY